MSNGTRTGVLLDATHELHLEQDGNDYYLVKEKGSPSIAIRDRGIMIGESTADELKQMLPGFNGQPGTYAIQQPVSKTIMDVTYTYQTSEKRDGNPLIIHTGTKSNQHLPVFINSMHPMAMGLDDAKIHLRDAALRALDTVDHAIDYALNEVTRMGAYQSRLSQTENNLVTSNENTTAAKSTIMDADLAKLMVEYTKDSVLSQSAQLMLAQANQNSSSVLNLLQ